MRVIGGTYRGRRLVAPKNTATRPTADRVRQALFDVLSSVVQDAVVLDLYSGTGALGIEALSRGAERAVLVENDAQALVALRSNVENLGLSSQVRVLPLPVGRAQKRLLSEAPFDVVFCDPPWDEATHVAEKVLGALLGADPSRRVRPEPLLRAGCWIVLEHSARKPIERLGGLGLRLLHQRSWGDSAVSIFG